MVLLFIRETVFLSMRQLVPLMQKMAMSWQVLMKMVLQWRLMAVESVRCLQPYIMR